MAFKKPTIQSAAPESPDRLFRDLPRRKHPSLYDHQGQILRHYVADALQAKDVALQLPTGSGKTLVGLLLAEWRRRKFGERVVYLCPTRQLVNQTVEEASGKYGLTIEGFTGKARNYSPAAKSAYQDAERVVVTTYSSLFNTNPFFSNPDIIIVDDAHAAENYIASQWTVRISRLNSEHALLFSATASVLRQSLSDINYSRIIGDWRSSDDAAWVDKIPTHEFVRIAPELRATISENVDGTDQRYAWSRIADHLTACQLYVSSSEIMIRPLIPPTWAHKPFADATQRIFMSATLGAGGDLERLTGRRLVKRLAIPEGWDKQGIGRRFFIFPEKSLSADDTVKLRHKLMERAGRSLVLTPSQSDADAISSLAMDNLGAPIFTADDLEVSKSTFIQSPRAVAVVANRYDGIDFPDDDCRLQFIEGLPRAASLQERFLMNRMGASQLFNDRVQTRVLQAIGRCTRGLNDFSAVVVTGEDLPAYLTDRKRRQHFHPELQAEIQFGIEQSTEVRESDILDNFNIFLEHEEGWEVANQSILDTRDVATQVPFPAMRQLESVVAHEISWQTALWDEDYENAFDAAREVLGKLTDPTLRGYRALWHYLAGSTAELASSHGSPRFVQLALEQFRKAKDGATGIPWLIGLARGADAGHREVDAADEALTLQVERLEAYLSRLGTLHNRDFSAREAQILSELHESAKFEHGHVLLGEHLGFTAGKVEADASPDPWWLIGNVAFVFEDHANANPETATIDATKARQAASHPNWLRAHVPGANIARIKAVLITPAKKAQVGALPHLHDVGYWHLDDFRAWARDAVGAIRALRRDFQEAGDLVWRAQAVTALKAVRADAHGLQNWLNERPASANLISVERE